MTRITSAATGPEIVSGPDAATVFGASAPAGILFEQFGFTADNVYARAKSLLA